MSQPLEVQKVDTLIIGAGLIGSSLAMHLAQMGQTGIRVIDFDLEGSLSSSELNAGGVRATWIESINIAMSKFTIDYFSTVAKEVGYQDCGYLWLHSPERMKLAVAAMDKQIASGWPVETLTVTELRSRFPFIDKTDDLAGAIFSKRDGLINPNLLKNHFRAKGKELGVVYDDRTLLKEVRYGSGAPVSAIAERFEAVMAHETKVEVLSASTKDHGRSRVEYRAERIVNCAGPWASVVAKILGYSSPSFPVRRQLSIFDSRELDLTPYGMIVDKSGVYFHHEATNGLAGFANEEPKGINYQYDESFFFDLIWPPLYERSTAFEKLKHLTGWAGLYEVSPDECGIVGVAGQGEIRKRQNVYEAHSFSGHGVMHSHAVGRLLAEKMLKGRYETLDASSLSAERFEKGEELSESLVI